MPVLGYATRLDTFFTAAYVAVFALIIYNSGRLLCVGPSQLIRSFGAPGSKAWPSAAMLFQRKVAPMPPTSSARSSTPSSSANLCTASAPSQTDSASFTVSAEALAPLAASQADPDAAPPTLPLRIIVPDASPLLVPPPIHQRGENSTSSLRNTMHCTSSFSSASADLAAYVFVGVIFTIASLFIIFEGR